MRNMLLFTFLVLFSSSAFAIDIGDLLGISKPARDSLKKDHVVMNKVSFDIDNDGTWDTCTTKPCSSIKNRADIFDLENDLGAGCHYFDKRFSRATSGTVSIKGYSHMELEFIEN